MAGSGYDGLVNGYEAFEWVSNLVIDGISGWRLPNIDINGDRVFNIHVNSAVFDMEFLATCFAGDTSGCLDNEMGYLYWVEGITTLTPEPFINVQPYVYLSETEHIGGNFFHFDFGNGLYGAQPIGNLFHLWAVHDGDIAPPSPIPEPSTYMMLLAGLGVLGYKIRIMRSKS